MRDSDLPAVVSILVIVFGLGLAAGSVDWKVVPDPRAAVGVWAAIFVLGGIGMLVVWVATFDATRKEYSPFQYEHPHELYRKMEESTEEES